MAISAPVSNLGRHGIKKLVEGYFQLFFIDQPQCTIIRRPIGCGAFCRYAVGHNSKTVISNTMFYAFDIYIVVVDVSKTNQFCHRICGIPISHDIRHRYFGFTMGCFNTISPCLRRNSEYGTGEKEYESGFIHGIKLLSVFGLAMRNAVEY